MRTSEKLPIGLKNIGYRLDPATWPDGSVCTLTTEISEDGGKTWRVNSQAKTSKSDSLPGGPFGASLMFRGAGNGNPEFMVRCSAKFGDDTEIDMVSAVEVIDDVLLQRDRR